MAERRRRWDGRFKLARQPDLRDCVSKRLAMGHSPGQIAGRLALEHGRVMISHESIYRFIYHRTAQKDYWHRQGRETDTIILVLGAISERGEELGC